MENSYILCTDKSFGKQQYRSDAKGLSFCYNHFDSQDKNIIMSDGALMDIIKLWERYMYTGDVLFLSQYYPKAEKLMETILSGLNGCGYIESVPRDLIFEDKSDMEKEGALGYKQVLLLKAMEAMSDLCKSLQKADKYLEPAKAFKKQFIFDYWDGIHGFRHCEHEYYPTKYANIFAILLDVVSASAAKQLIDISLKKTNIAQISIRDMKFFEACALHKCGNGRADFTGLDEMQIYYILEKYYVGLKPICAGFKEFEICPDLNNYESIEGKTHTSYGFIEYYLSCKKINVRCPKGTKGTLTTGKDKFEFEESIEIKL